jgi:hypothetical protein
VGHTLSVGQSVAVVVDMNYVEVGMNSVVVGMNSVVVGMNSVVVGMNYASKYLHYLTLDLPSQLFQSLTSVNILHQPFH